MGNLPAVLKPNSAIVARQEFGAEQTTALVETSASAVAAQAKAAVEARYVLALRKPREWEEVRVRLERECKRTGFAAVAKYVKPIGKDRSKWPTGPSIRFAEAALRCMTNVYPETSVIYDDAEKRIVQVSVTDLEANLTYSSQIVINKTVERRQVKDGQEVIGQRKNSYGDDVYVVRATEDDLLNKQNALISKALRTNALRLLPGDILDGCLLLIDKTLRDETRQDPDAAKRKIIDAFESVGVGPSDLVEYVGHSLDRLQPAEIDDLRAIYSAIKDGEATWDGAMEAKNPAGTVEAAEDVAKAKIERLKAQQEPPAPAQTTAVVQPQTQEIPEVAELPDGAADGARVRWQGKLCEWRDDGWKRVDEAPAAEKPKLTFGRRPK